LLAEFKEIESGKNNDRPKLIAAIRQCKVTGATLIVAKLDRLSRDVEFLAKLQKGSVKFTCCDMPEANEMVIGIMSVMAQAERKAISERTRAAMQAAKASGRTFGGGDGSAFARAGWPGNPAAVKAIAAQTAERDADIMPVIEDIQASGIETLHGIASELNRRQIRTARAGQWYAGSVRRMLLRKG
jgi:DNA invertase Pin-like site-specific DNA recombinase